MAVSVRLVAALVGTAAALAGIGGCAASDADADFDPEPRPVAEVEAETFASAQRVAELAGGTLTNWRTTVNSCDVARPGRSWVLVGWAEIPVPDGDPADLLGPVHDRLARAGWELDPNQPRPQPSPSASGYLDVTDPHSHVSLTVKTGPEPGVLALTAGGVCYDAVDGENPANAAVARR